jgi:hypothetical protein
MESCYQLAIRLEKDGDRTTAKELLQNVCQNNFPKACKALERLSIPEQKASTASGSPPRPAAPLPPLDGTLRADLDRDGRAETVGWQKSSSSELGDFYRLLVFDDDGSLLWKGPGKADETDPLTFFSLDTGISLPQILADFDLDGSMELLAPVAQSDVSPTYYRKLRWRGDRFEALLPNALMLKPGSGDRFVWKTVLRPEGTWVSKLSPAGNNLYRAEVTRMSGEGETSMGEVLIEFVRGGAIIRRVTHPLSRVGGEQGDAAPPASEPAVAGPLPAAPPPTHSSAVYRARIGRQDHFNSRGIRLKNPASILRQDRANFYRRRGDPEDRPDPYFRTRAARNSIEHMPILPVNVSHRTLRRLLLNGTPLLEINVTPRELKVRVLER